MKEQNARAAPKLRFTKEETEMNPLDELSAKKKQAVRRASKVKRPGRRKTSISRESSKAPLSSASQEGNNLTVMNVSLPETKMNDNPQPVTDIVLSECFDL